MYFFVSLIPATIWAVLGYFLLFTSARAQGPMQVLGRVLSIWVLVIAALFPAAGAYAMFADLSPISAMMQSMHCGASAQP